MGMGIVKGAEDPIDNRRPGEKVDNEYHWIKTEGGPDKGYYDKSRPRSDKDKKFQRFTWKQWKKGIWQLHCEGWSLKPDLYNKEAQDNHLYIIKGAKQGFTNEIAPLMGRAKNVINKVASEQMTNSVIDHWEKDFKDVLELAEDWEWACTKERSDKQLAWLWTSRVKSNEQWDQIWEQTVAEEMNAGNVTREPTEASWYDGREEWNLEGNKIDRYDFLLPRECNKKLYTVTYQQKVRKAVREKLKKENTTLVQRLLEGQDPQINGKLDKSQRKSRLERWAKQWSHMIIGDEEARDRCLSIEKDFGDQTMQEEGLMLFDLKSGLRVKMEHPNSEGLSWCSNRHGKRWERNLSQARS